MIFFFKKPSNYSSELENKGILLGFHFNTPAWNEYWDENHRKHKLDEQKYNFNCETLS